MSKYPFARIAIAAPISNLGGSSFSKNKHPYSSPPPSKRGTKVKRNMSDQFCTRRSCSESVELHKDAGGWGVRPAINSGHSSTKAQCKVVPLFERKEQRGFQKGESWGERVPTKSMPSDKVLDNRKAQSVLLRLAMNKAEKLDRKRKLAESRQKLGNEIVNELARRLANAKPQQSRKSDVIFSLGNAFAGI